MFYLKDKKLGTQTIQFVYFPDKTSQLDITLKNIKVDSVVWYYQQESEIAQLIQILYNLKTQTVHIPFLPYGRQDHSKDYNALYSFLNFLHGMYPDVIFTTDDLHSNDPYIKHILQNNPPTKFHNKYIETISPNYIIFPDSGAKTRYAGELETTIPTYSATKVRDLKGNITAFSLDHVNITLNDGDTVAIIDDICDGGATFINIAQCLKNINPNINIDLVVSHPLLTKGVKHLQLTGIRNCYTYIHGHYQHRNQDDFIKFIKV